MGPHPLEIRFEATRQAEEVGALLLRPTEARALLVLAHGAGAGMRHPFLEALSASLAARAVATFRYQFPYMDRKAGRPDPRAVLISTVHAAVRAAARECGDVPLFAGGKSMGGRMTSLAAAEDRLDSVRGLVFVGFPLHPAGRATIERADHLESVAQPMLFLQGTRDRLSEPELIKPVCERLGPRVTLHMVEEADHAFHVPKRTGRTDRQIIDELADVSALWIARH